MASVVPRGLVRRVRLLAVPLASRGPSRVLHGTSFSAQTRRPAASFSFVGCHRVFSSSTVRRTDEGEGEGDAKQESANDAKMRRFVMFGSICTVVVCAFLGAAYL